MSPRAGLRRTPQLLLAYGLPVALTLVVLYPANPANMPVPISRDSGVFLYGGWRLLHGELPYRDVWDHKPPVIFYLNALGLALAGGSRWGVWLLEAASLSLAAGLALRLLRRAFGLAAGLAGLYLGWAAMVFLLEGGNFTTEFALPVQWGALALANSAGAAGQRLGRRGLAIGALSGLAFFTKQNTIGVGVAIALYVLLAGLRSGQWQTALPDLAQMAGGAILAGVVILAPFALANVLPELWSAVFVYNLAYGAASTNAERLIALGRGLVALLSTNLTGLALSGWGFGLLRALRRNLSGPLTPLVGVALLDLPVELLMVSASGRSFAHYYLALLPPFMILAAFAIHALTEAVLGASKLSRTEAQVGVLAGVLIVGALVQVKSPLDYARVIADAASFNRSQLDIIAEVQRHSDPSETVLVMGAEVQINFLAQRRAPTRYAYQAALHTLGYTTPAMVESFYADLQRNPPRLIVDMTGQGLANDYGIDTQRVEEGVAFLQTHCAVQQAREGWAIYECREQR
jgi:hypothetical protein